MVTPNSNTSEKSNEASSGFKVPNIDMNAVMDSYKKNLEVLGLINKMSVEVFNGIVKLQSAFIKQMMTDAGSVMEKSGKPSDLIAKFNEATVSIIEKAVGNSKQISDMLTTSTNDLRAAVSKRIKESVEEAKNIVHKN